MLNRFRRITALAGALAVVATGAVVASSAPAQAAPVVGVSAISPTTGLGATPNAQLRTSGGCADPSVGVRAKAFGFGFPEAGQTIVNQNTLAFSTEGPMTMNLSNTWSNFATLNSTYLNGSYEIRVQCVTNLGIPQTEYTGSLSFTTPGNSVANVENATYTAGAAATTTTLVSSLPSPQNQNTAVTLTATIASVWTPAGGTVTFRDGATVLGTAPVVNGVATKTGATLPNSGERSLTAAYDGVTGWDDSTSVGLPFSVIPVAGPTTFTAVKAPAIGGIVQVGKKVTASGGTWTPAPTTTSYQWLRSGAAIGGANKAAYTIGGADKGKALSVRVTVTKTGITTAVRTSAAITVKAGVFAKTKKPAVSGKFKVGKKVKATRGGFAPLPSGYKYQWLRNGKVIAKATKPTYKLTKKDRKKKISVRVTASATGYTNAVQVSASKKVK